MKRSIPEFIEKLVSLTKSGDLEWRRVLPGDLEETDKFTPPILSLIQMRMPDLLSRPEVESFAAEYSGGRVVLRRFSLPPTATHFLEPPSSLILALQPAVDGRLEALNGHEEYQSPLIRLYNLIIHKRVPVEDYIESFFSD